MNLTTAALSVRLSPPSFLNISHGGLPITASNPAAIFGTPVSS
jgi:hypothetical protein